VAAPVKVSVGSVVAQWCGAIAGFAFFKALKTIEEGRRYRSTKRLWPTEVVEAGRMAMPLSTQLTANWLSELRLIMPRCCPLVLMMPE
jgi:hypothetical protein